MGDGRAGPCPSDLECPFLGLRGNGTFWLPLLVLNGTSVSNGQRILTTSLERSYKPVAGKRCVIDKRDGNCLVFPEAYHFHDLVNPSGISGAEASDIRLSTAASNSARFPLVSPAGEVVPVKAKAPVDRIVDGGYLENLGVLSALDLVNAINALQPKLNPFIVVISNDPSIAIDPQLPPAEVAANYASDVTSALSAVATTRDARASLGLVHLTALVDRQNASCSASLVHIRVWPFEPRQGRPQCQEGVGEERSAVISMSWWLSKPVQLRLVAELDQLRCNAPRFDQIWTALSAKGGCGP
jgi:hypothetical protein